MGYLQSGTRGTPERWSLAALWCMARTLLLLAGIAAWPAHGTQSIPVEDPASLLKKIQGAARTLDYSGVFIYQQGTNMQTSRLVHMVDGTGERERLEALDGQPREFIRHNGTVQVLLPEKKLVVVEERRIDRFPGLLLGEGGQVADYYSFSRDPGSFRTAGRECSLLYVKPRDNLRFGYKLCIDSETNLLMRAQTIDLDGSVVDQIGFTSLQLSEEVDIGQLQPRWDVNGWRTVSVATEPVDFTSQGWRVAMPPGFSSLTQISRPMASGRSVKQMVITDGLAAISVFIEPFEEQRSRPYPHGAGRNGAINIYGTRIGDHWLTAIGQVPPDTLRELAERTQYVPAAGSH